MLKANILVSLVLSLHKTFFWVPREIYFFINELWEEGFLFPFSSQVKSGEKVPQERTLSAYKLLRGNWGNVCIKSI